MDDFSCEHLLNIDDNQLMDDLEQLGEDVLGILNTPVEDLQYTIGKLNAYRKLFLKTKNKIWWWQMIQLLPSSYNQKRTVMLNYEVLSNIYQYRREHKLDEWREFCQWIKKLPYSEIITCNVKGEDNA